MTYFLDRYQFCLEIMVRMFGIMCYLILLINIDFARPGLGYSYRIISITWDLIHSNEAHPMCDVNAEVTTEYIFTGYLQYWLKIHNDHCYGQT